MAGLGVGGGGVGKWLTRGQRKTRSKRPSEARVCHVSRVTGHGSRVASLPVLLLRKNPISCMSKMNRVCILQDVLGGVE